MEAVSRGDTALVLEREIELAAVDAFLADLTGGVSRFVAVEGPGGSAKRRCWPKLVPPDARPASGS